MAGVFMVSSTFPLALAFGTDARAFVYRVYRASAHGLLLLLAVFFLAGDRVAWASALPGFAWRAWLFVWRPEHRASCAICRALAAASPTRIA